MATNESAIKTAQVTDRTPSLDEKVSYNDEKDDIYKNVDVHAMEDDLEALDEDMQAVHDSERLTYEDAKQLVQEIVDEYQLDPNFPPHLMESASRFLTDENLKEDPVAYRRIFAELQVAASFLYVLPLP